MSRKLDRLRTLLAAELEARPLVYQVLLVGPGDVAMVCVGHVTRRLGLAAEVAVAEADEACAPEHPHAIAEGV